MRLFFSPEIQLIWQGMFYQYENGTPQTTQENTACAAAKM